MFANINGSSSMYKRMTSRDYSNHVDIENDSDDFNSDLLQDATEHNNSNPSWKLSLPHVLVATIVSFLFGYHIGVVNEPLEIISFDLGFSGNTLAEGLVVSTCLAGAFLGSLVSGWVADGVGRRRTFQLCALPMLAGSSLCATATTLTGMLVGRFLVGIGLGVGPPVASLYVTEVSPAHVRGTYGSFIQIATCLGVLGALLIGIPVKDIPGWWRYCFWASIIPASLLAVGMIFCAESPHWLFKKILIDEERRIISQVEGDFGKRGRIPEAEAEFEKLLGLSHVTPAISELAKLDRGDDTDTVSFTELFLGRHSRVIYIGSALYALQQLSGINAVFYFSSTVFRHAGVSSNLANTFVGVANLAGSVVALILMDNLGRRVLLLWSFLGMAAAMALQVFAAGLSTANSGSFYFSVGGMLLFVFTFAVGAGPVPALLLPEIFPSQIRAKAMAFCMAVHWALNFLVGLTFLRLLEQMGPQLLYSMFGTFCLMAVMFVKKNVVETKGKSLQEIEIALLPQWINL